MFEGYAGTQDEIEAEKLRRSQEHIEAQANKVVSLLPNYAINETEFRSRLVETDNSDSLNIVLGYIKLCMRQFRYYKKLIKMEIKNKRRLQSGN